MQRIFIVLLALPFLIGCSEKTEPGKDDNQGTNVEIPAKDSGSLPGEIQDSLPTMFQQVRNKIHDRYLREGKGSENYAGAVKAWGEFLGNPKVSRRDKHFVGGQVEKLNRMADAAWRTLLSRAEKMNNEDADQTLRENLPRFEGCVFKGSDLGKEIRDKIKELGG